MSAPIHRLAVRTWPSVLLWKTCSSWGARPHRRGHHLRESDRPHSLQPATWRCWTVINGASSSSHRTAASAGNLPDLVRASCDGPGLSPLSEKIDCLCTTPDTNRCSNLGWTATSLAKSALQPPVVCRLIRSEVSSERCPMDGFLQSRRQTTARGVQSTSFLWRVRGRRFTSHGRCLTKPHTRDRITHRPTKACASRPWSPWWIRLVSRRGCWRPLFPTAAWL